MPKHESMTAKAASNRMKSVGLQKLRWFCQMCQKQCRDENGFKCHLTSDSHLRQMRVFAENPNSIISDFSRDFERTFLDILSHRHGTKRVKANLVYQELIADKMHVHMNSTAWSSLTGFCKHLGREGKAVVDETEKGWYIQYIDRDPKTIERQAQRELREKSELDEQERTTRMINAQVVAASKRLGGDGEAEEEDTNREFCRENEEDKIEMTITVDQTKKRARPAIVNIFELNDAAPQSTSQPSQQSSQQPHAISTSSSSAATTITGTNSIKKPCSALDQIMLNDQRKRAVHAAEEERRSRRDYWLHAGILVKIMNKKLSDGKYYKQKAAVLRVHDHYVADVQLAEGGSAVLRLDQQDLETVVPKVDGQGLVLNGRRSGCICKVVKINEDTFNCLVQLEDKDGGEQLLLDYEDVSRLCEE